MRAATSSHLLQIKRFADHLYKSGELEKYMQLLVDNFNPATIPETMCRHTYHRHTYHRHTSYHRYTSYHRILTTPPDNVPLAR